jgi:hypothetical protein
LLFAAMAELASEGVGQADTGCRPILGCAQQTLNHVTDGLILQSVLLNYFCLDGMNTEAKKMMVGFGHVAGNTRRGGQQQQASGG